MSKLRKAAQELIAASESCDIDQGTGSWASDDAWSALVDALEDALAQPEQEPVAYQWLDTSVTRKRVPKGAEADAWQPLYTTPLPCPTCEALARTVMMDQTGRDA